MRYKSTPLSIRDVPVPHGTKPRASRSDRPKAAWLIALILPILLVPWASASAAGTIALNPGQSLVGAAVRVSGQGFSPNTRGQILFDGLPAGMPTFRVDHAGSLTATFTVPLTAAIGGHTVTASASTTQGKKAAVGVTVASATLMVSATPAP
ncbi:MAG: hypothetical protein QOH18_2545, partial [Solirubrobacterales bacterium]|nr:hypothetical protein [Solirubrobacterales bacterium]